MRGLLAAVVVTVLAVRAGCAQAPPGFAELAFPAGVSATVDSLGKLVHVIDGATLRVWSAFTRRWHALPVQPGVATYQTNDLLLVRDGSVWTGFAASRGRFAPLAVSAAAVQVNAPSRNNDSVALVRDGALLHAFSGFTGRWTTRSVGPSAFTDVQRHTALLADGALLAGFDAFSGQWHDLPAAGPAVALSADGVCGVATTATTVLGFSSLRGTWTAAPRLAGATLVRDDDWAVWHDGVQLLGFSGPVGAFATAVSGPVAQSRGEDLFGALFTPGGAHLFSAITGTFAQVAFGPSASVRTNVATALVVDGPQVVAYSAPRGQLVPLAIDAVNEAVAGSVAAVVDRITGQPYLFSSLLGAWLPAPADVLPGVPRLGTTGALLATAAGLRAFSARSGAFVPLALPGATAESNENSAPLVAWNAASIAFFDGRIDAWQLAARTGVGNPNVQIWRTNAIAMDSGELLGFGVQSGVVHRTPMTGPVLAFRANSESASVTTATSLFAGSGLPLPTSLVQFPDFRRVLTIGAPFRLHLPLLAGDLALLGLGARAAAPLPLPGLGDLRLDPASLQTFALAPEADADRARFELVVPADPALQGARGWFQALIAPATGTPYLTDATEVWVG